MKNELVGIYKPYANQARTLFCYKCHERIEDDLVFTRHIMKEENLEFRHYHLDHAPKRFKEYMVRRLKDFVQAPLLKVNRDEP